MSGSSTDTGVGTHFGAREEPRRIAESRTALHGLSGITLSAAATWVGRRPLRSMTISCFLLGYCS